MIVATVTLSGTNSLMKLMNYSYLTTVNKGSTVDILSKIPAMVLIPEIKHFLHFLDVSLQHFLEDYVCRILFIRFVIK